MIEAPDVLRDRASPGIRVVALRHWAIREHVFDLRSHRPARRPRAPGRDCCCANGILPRRPSPGAMPSALHRAMSARTLLAPEVIQTSAMDCGPASLKCLLDGFGLNASYGRLREACQTDVDGTSIDTLEDIACELGLDAQQVMVPPDFLLLPS